MDENRKRAVDSAVQLTLLLAKDHRLKSDLHLWQVGRGTRQNTSHNLTCTTPAPC